METTTSQKIGWKTASGLVIANIIGTGVFTSLGYQLVEVQNTYSIILLWLIGGVLSLIGAFTYAELGTHFKESGGDYIFLSRIYHPFAGYLYAWTSLIVGFSGPVAIATMAMIHYLEPVGLGQYSTFIGIGIIVLISAMHSVSIRQSGKFQDYSTIIKILFVIFLIIAGFYYLPLSGNALKFDDSWQSEILKPGYAVAPNLRYLCLCWLEFRGLYCK